MKNMIDLHTHTFFSDGALVPAEHLRRFEKLEYEAVAVTDHVDSSNFDFILERMQRVAQDLNSVSTTKLIAGVELTHVPPSLIEALAARCRALHAGLIVVHGETPVEPVAPGTNRAAIEAGVDVLAHPGFITEEDALLAANKGVALELTVRGGHSLTNGHVARMAEKTGAKLVVNSDGHHPRDFMTAELARKVALGAGLDEARYQQIRNDMRTLAQSALQTR
jgi:histidinol phosphatase-like PHP family hydrolase